MERDCYLNKQSLFRCLGKSNFLREKELDENVDLFTLYIVPYTPTR